METGDSSYNDLVDILKRDLEGTPPPFEVLNTTNAAQATLPPQQQQQQQQQQQYQQGGGGFSTSPTAAGVHGGHVAVSPVQQQFQSLNVQSSQRRSSMSSTSTTSSTSQQAAASSATVRPYIKIVEQPAGKALRFRYECEGRSAGSIPGVNSTPELKTFPTIEIVGYEGDVVVVVSCVTKDPPYRPHPHNLVGKEGCKNGICQLTLKGKPLKAVFSNLGIQCVKKKDIKVALDLREKIQVDPFKTKFDHKDQPSSIDLNAVRLAFQAFLKTADGIRKLTPVVSDPIYDRKAMSGLVICRLCSCSAKVGGGDEIILLCEKVCKDDIKVKFYEVNAEGQVVWEDYADFQQTDIHKQTAIAFRTPRYHNPDITERANVFLQLLRPSDGVTSESLPFEYYPDPDQIKRKRIKTGGNQILKELQNTCKPQTSAPNGNGNNKFNNNATPVNTFQNDFQDILSGATTWNTNQFLPEIKTEPAMSPSPQHFAQYRSPYNTLTPSPQPMSPMNRNNTPSPCIMKTLSGSSQTQMCEIFNMSSLNDPNSPMAVTYDYDMQQPQQQQHQQQQQLQYTQLQPSTSASTSQMYNNFGQTANGGGVGGFMMLSPSANNGSNCDDNNKYNSNNNLPGTVAGSFDAFNTFGGDQKRVCSSMSGGTMTPLRQGDTMTNGGAAGGNTNPFYPTMNITAPENGVQLQQQQQQQQQMFMQQQQQQQQFQQLPNDIEAITNTSTEDDAPTLSGLLAMMEPEEFVSLKSDDLRLANSISI